MGKPGVAGVQELQRFRKTIALVGFCAIEPLTGKKHLKTSKSV
jgi:hypothetical protein